MTDKTPATLDRLWDDIPTGHAPIGDLLTAGRAAKRRKRRAVLAGTVAATAFIVGGGFAVTQALPGGGDRGDSLVAHGARDDLDARVERDVSKREAALLPPLSIGDAAAVWDPQAKAVIYVSEIGYSGSCAPTASVWRTDSGAVTLNVHDYDSGGLCTADARPYFVRIDGFSAAPQELTVTDSGKTRVIPVSAGRPTLNEDLVMPAQANETLAVGESGPMSLFLHCGLRYVSVGSEVWETTPRGDGSAPVGLPERLTGTATRIGANTIVFTSPQLAALYGSDRGNDQIVFHPASATSDQGVCY